MFTIPAHTIHDVKTSPGILLLIGKIKPNAKVTFRVVDLKSGQVLRRLCEQLRPDCPLKLNFAHYAQEKLYYMQQNDSLVIKNVLNLKSKRIGGDLFATIPDEFVFLDQQRLFLTVSDGNVAIFDLHACKQANLAQHRLWVLKDAPKSLHLVEQQSLLISFCHNPRAATAAEDYGCINISNILTGRSVARIVPDPSDPCLTYAISSTTAVFFNSETNELLTGNKYGQVFLWRS
eukprot:GCRY01000886.1.p1 GENE.GCRY01000886.1~~GCRY01000886.1.p1  ORF type:complete len:233 (-),score=35.22 GCRY01000886.1:117-815(-)